MQSNPLPPPAKIPLHRTPGARALAALPLLLALASCGGEKSAPPKPTPTVGVVIARPASVAIGTELPGRTEAYRISDVRPQVSGIVLKRLFTEGGDVREGQPLYLIDPALYHAAVNQAQGQLASAQANAVAARLKAERFNDLETINAVAKQDAADARAAAGQAEAAIAQQKAALDTARTYIPGNNRPCGLGKRARSVTAPVDGSTVTSENSSVPASE